MAAIGIADSRRGREVERLRLEIEKLGSRRGPIAVSGPYSSAANDYAANVIKDNARAVAQMREQIAELEALTGDELIRRFAPECL